MSATTKKAAGEPSRTTAAEKRYSEALVYLHANEVEINSRTDIYYRKALQIAAGVKSNDK